MSIVKCLRCKKDFSVKGKRKFTAKYCSMKCKINRETIICPVCDKSVVDNVCNKRKYCSRRCFHLSLLGKEGWNKGNIGFLAGEKHYNWKGGITSENVKLRQVFKEHIQKQVFQRDDFTCQICSVRGGYLQVDHIKSWKDYPELRFDLDNCRTLCMACHYYVTFKRKMPKGIVWGHNLTQRIA